jgi:predicted nucleic acid-binding protein
MKAVVDTNVIAYYLLGTSPFAQETKVFWRSVEAPMAPPVWEAELANVLWMSTRSGVLTVPEARRRLVLSLRLGIASVASRSLWQGALLRSAKAGVAVYDTLFVELAVRCRLPLATFDKQLLKVFPDVAARPQQLTDASWAG